GVFIRLVHEPDRTLITVASVGLSSLGLCDAQRIARFEEFQWQFGIQHHWVELVAGGDVAAALQKFILCMHCLGGSSGVRANHVFKLYYVSGLAHGMIGLCW